MKSKKYNINVTLDGTDVMGIVGAVGIAVATIAYTIIDWKTDKDDYELEHALNKISINSLEKQNTKLTQDLLNLQNEVEELKKKMEEK